MMSTTSETDQDKQKVLSSLFLHLKYLEEETDRAGLDEACRLIGAAAESVQDASAAHVTNLRPGRRPKTPPGPAGR